MVKVAVAQYDGVDIPEVNAKEVRVEDHSLLARPGIEKIRLFDGAIACVAFQFYPSGKAMFCYWRREDLAVLAKWRSDCMRRTGYNPVCDVVHEKSDGNI